MTTSRRRFIQKSATLTAAAGLYGILPSSLLLSGCGHQKKASDRIRVALIGCRNMGYSNVTQFIQQPDVDLVALCDIDENILNQRAADITKFAYEHQLNIPKPALFGVFRKVLDLKDLDAVIVATPDHWHALITIMACQAGKDVYVEKPMANSIWEAEQMVKAGQRFKRIIQVGQWQRSGPHWMSMVDYLKSGKLGKVERVDVWRYGGNPVPPKPDEAVPPGVDYNMWLGPAPERPFNPNRFHYNFRWFWDYAGGKMTDWGVHLLDMAMWGLDVDHPNEISASGGNLVFPNDQMETPDTLTVDYRFGDLHVFWKNDFGLQVNEFDMDHGLIFHGENGMLLANRSFWRVDAVNQQGPTSLEPVEAVRAEGQDLTLHVRNFLDAIKTRDANTACHAGIGLSVARIAHMGNIAYRTRQNIHWDEGSGKFNETAANELIRPKYREPWEI